jgi:hypothetical protein
LVIEQLGEGQIFKINWGRKMSGEIVEKKRKRFWKQISEEETNWKSLEKMRKGFLRKK